MRKLILVSFLLPMNLYRRAKFDCVRERCDFGTDGVNIYYSVNGPSTISVFNQKNEEICLMRRPLDCNKRMCCRYRTINGELFIIIVVDFYVILTRGGEVLDKKYLANAEGFRTEGIKDSTGYFNSHIGCHMIGGRIDEYRIIDSKLVQLCYFSTRRCCDQIVMIDDHVYHISCSHPITVINNRTSVLTEIPYQYDCNRYNDITRDNKYLVVRHFDTPDSADIVSIPSFVMIGSYQIFEPFGAVNGIIVCYKLHDAIDRHGVHCKITPVNESHYEYVPAGDGVIITQKYENVYVYDFIWNWNDFMLQTAKIRRLVICIIIAFKRIEPRLYRDLVRHIIALVMKN